MLTDAIALTGACREGSPDVPLRTWLQHEEPDHVSCRTVSCRSDREVRRVAWKPLAERKHPPSSWAWACECAWVWVWVRFCLCFCFNRCQCICASLCQCFCPCFATSLKGSRSSPKFRDVCLCASVSTVNALVAESQTFLSEDRVTHPDLRSTTSPLGAVSLLGGFGFRFLGVFAQAPVDLFAPAPGRCL